MWENLRLESGPMRDIYAIIYGFSQDGDSACACTLKYFEEWTGASERNVQYCLNALVDAGYITKEKVNWGPNSFTEYRANLEIVEECRKGAKYAPIEKGAKTCKKRCKNVQKKVQILHPDNNNIIIYKNIILSRMGAKQQKEEKNIYDYFFWKNAAAPRKETDAFLRWAELGEWKDGKGRELDTQRKVLAWADGWEMRNGSARTDAHFLKFWNYLYSWLLVEGNPIAGEFIDPKIAATVTDSAITIALPEKLMNTIEELWVNSAPDDPKRVLISCFRKGRILSYEPFVL